MNQTRELFEKWAKSECLDTDSVDGFYSDNDTHIAWGAWQAAQSAAVPVVGDVVAWLKSSSPESDVITTSVRKVLSGCYGGRFYLFDTPLIIQPATSITAAELDALRKDAERLDAAMKIMFDDWHPLSVAFSKMQTASTKDELFEQLDAAIAREKKHG